MKDPLDDVVRVNGGSIAYQIAGAGPAVVLVHPGLWDMRVWDDRFALFAERFSVLRYDVRRYGRSTRPTGAPYSHERDQAADHDPPHLQRASAELARRIRGAVTVAIPDTDHVVGMRRPREFNDAVLAFLDRTS
jgi:pimeloyl-ACP methyl ester carboxylesterase